MPILPCGTHGRSQQQSYTSSWKRSRKPWYVCSSSKDEPLPSRARTPLNVCYQVNRLARELSALRAQHSASVASNASSSNTSAIDPSQAAPEFQPPGSASRRHRSSSSLSTRSFTSHGQFQPLGTTTSQASVDRARDAVGMRSREDSLAGVGLPLVSRSRAPSASPSPLLMSDAQPYFSSNRYEEVERARAALEVAKRENDRLAARVRELEGILRDKNEPSRGRERPLDG